jgi:hypothetical protein
MKKILIPTLLFAVLASCASDKGPVDESKFKVTKPVKKVDVEANKLLPLAPSSAAECVTINGKFKRTPAKPADQASVGSIKLAFEEVEISTKRENEKASYSLNGTFVIADGQAREENGTKATAVCNKTGFELTTTKDGKTSRVQFILESQNSLKIASEGADVTSLNGIYARVEAAAPAPAPGEGSDTL